MNSITMKMQADKLIRMALQEDITSEDVSTNAVMRSAVKGTVDLIAKEDGIIAGLDVYARVFQILDEKTEISFNFKDGEAVKKGNLLGTVTGDIRVLLSGERVALNYLQRMSGIATYTKQVSKLLEGSKVTLLDTRKTTPNCRVFEKYAVRIGGGCNHRYNLSDGVLLKDNHIGAAGSVAKAVAMAKEYAPFVRKIEPDFCTCHTSFIFRNFHIKHKCNITKSFIHRILKIRGIFICIQQSYKQAGFCLLIIPDHSCFLINIRLFYPIQIICDFFYNFLKRTAILIRFKKFLCIKSTDLPGIIMLCKLHQQSVSYRRKPPAFFLKRNIFPRNPCSLVNTNLQFLYECFIVFLHIQFLSCFENNTGRMP